MGVAFVPQQVLGRGDLDIFLQNCHGHPANAAEIYYALYYVDPGPPETEVLIGSDHRTPVNPQVGEYYASLMVPSNACAGTYRIRWYFRENVNSPLQMVVQEFAIVSECQTTGSSSLTQCEQELVNSLRILLRDQCVGAEETVEVDVDGERMVVSMEDLWEVLHDLPQPG